MHVPSGVPQVGAGGGRVVEDLGRCNVLPLAAQLWGGRDAVLRRSLMTVVAAAARTGGRRRRRSRPPPLPALTRDRPEPISAMSAGDPAQSAAAAAAGNVPTIGSRLHRKACVSSRSMLIQGASRLIRVRLACVVQDPCGMCDEADWQF